MQFTRFPFIYATQTKLQLKLFELRLIVASNRLTRRERDSPTIYLLAVIRIMQNTIDATTFLKTKLRDRTAYEGTFFFPLLRNATIQPYTILASKLSNFVTFEFFDLKLIHTFSLRTKIPHEHFY